MVVALDVDDGTGGIGFDVDRNRDVRQVTLKSRIVGDDALRFVSQAYCSVAVALVPEALDFGQGLVSGPGFPILISQYRDQSGADRHEQDQRAGQNGGSPQNGRLA